MSRRLTAALILTGALSGLIAALIFRPNLSSVLPGSLGGESELRASDEPPPNPYLHLVAQGIGKEVAVYGQPSELHPPKMRLANPTEIGVPVTFLVKKQKAGWYLALLPVRPNGTTGWIKSSEVKTTRHEYRIEISLSQHRVTVFNRDGVFLSEPVGIGKGPTPTPIGTFYTKELLKPPNPDTAYGAYAYGLSGYSNVLTDFADGDGVVGLHGTNDPAALGKDVSHGCIRMSNAGITRLAKTLPLGVPVIIEP